MNTKERNSYSYRHQWKSFFQMVHKAKVPWYLFVLTFIMDALTATLFVKLPVLLGDIMQGDIFTHGKITQYGFLSLTQVLLNFLTILLFSWVCAKIDISTADAVWNKSLRLSARVLDREKPSTLTSRVTNDSSNVSLVASGFFNAIGAVYSVILVYYEMFKMHRGLTAILMIVPVWMLISMKIVGNMSYKAQRKVQDKLSVFTSFLAVRLPNMRQVKANGTEKSELQLGGKKIQDQYEADLTIVKVNALSGAFRNISTMICNVVVLAYGSYQVASGGMDVGDLITFFLFVTQGTFTTNTETFLLYYQNIKLGLGGCSKIVDMMIEDEEILTREKSFTVPEADIVFSHVSFQYEDEPILQDISITIPKGKVTAIIGPNGSGKTTVLKLLERFYTPNEGLITYGGEDIEHYHLNDWRASIGYVVQNSPILQGTVEENITYGMEQPDKKAAVRVSQDVDAYAFIQNMDKGMESDVGELGSKLSGGQRQKLAIARALINNPELILLDEATCGLDAHSEYEIHQALNRILSGKTVVMIAHSMEAVKHADQIIVLDNGTVVDTGTHEQLLKKNELYQKYCTMNA